MVVAASICTHTQDKNHITHITQPAFKPIFVLIMTAGTSSSLAHRTTGYDELDSAIWSHITVYYMHFIVMHCHVYSMYMYIHIHIHTFHPLTFLHPEHGDHLSSETTFCGGLSKKGTIVPTNIMCGQKSTPININLHKVKKNSPKFLDIHADKSQNIRHYY